MLRSYRDYNTLKQVTHFYRAVPETVKTVCQLTTLTQANHLFLILPLESFGTPAGLVDTLRRTDCWDGGGGILLSNDDLPNSGVITVARRRETGQAISISTAMETGQRSGVVGPESSRIGPGADYRRFRLSWMMSVFPLSLQSQIPFFRIGVGDSDKKRRHFDISFTRKAGTGRVGDEW
jgi:hypothetical protein